MCVCNRLSDRQIRAAAASGECRTALEVYRRLGGRVQCGKCLSEVCRLFHEAHGLAHAARRHAHAHAHGADDEPPAPRAAAV